MFIRKAAFECLVKRSESQQQQIDKLNEMVGMLAKSVGQLFEVDFGTDWNSQPTGDNLINDGRHRIGRFSCSQRVHNHKHPLRNRQASLAVFKLITNSNFANWLWTRIT